MGQRLERPSATPSSSTVITPNATVQGAVSSSLSTTFSSSSASSTSSSSSNASALNNTNNNIQRNETENSQRNRNRRVQGSRASHSEATSSNSTENNADTANMSPRSRFRAEMSRRGYTNSSSDLFFRLFQFPNQLNNSSTIGNSSQATSEPNVANITPLPQNPTDSSNITPTQSNVSSLSSSRRTGNPSSSGLSAFRFFNIGGTGNNNTDDLDSDLSTDEDEPHWNTTQLAHSLPFFFGVRDFKCFVCSKTIPADDVEAHIMMCLTKPRLKYNEDVLADNKGECIICFEELEKGQKIARLQCLCIYHKHCIESWLTKSQSCPGHPPD